MYTTGSNKAHVCMYVYNGKQHLTFNNVGICWPTMLRPFAWGLEDKTNNNNLHPSGNLCIG